jgi:hypothetical protein
VTGKGDDVRPYDRKKYNENFDKIFGSRSTAPITKILNQLRGMTEAIITIYLSLSGVFILMLLVTSLIAYIIKR